MEGRYLCQQHIALASEIFDQATTIRNSQISQSRINTVTIQITAAVKS
jgi:hypothetical protein